MKPSLQLSTWETYETDLRCHILPYFREHPRKLSKLTKSALDGYCNEKLECGKVRGNGGLAPKTIKNHFGILSKALQDATDERIILYNPAALTRPRQSRNTSPIFTPLNRQMRS